MTIGKKIIGGYAFVLALLVIAVLTGYYALNTVVESYAGESDWVKKFDDAGRLRFLAQGEISNYRGHLLYPEDQREYLNDLEENHLQFNETVENLREAVSTEKESAELLSSLDAIIALHNKYKQMHEDMLSTARHNHTEALALGEREAQPVEQELIERIDRFSGMLVKSETQYIEAFTSNTKRLSLVMGGVSIAALISGFGIGFYITRSINSQLRDAVARISSSSAEILSTTTQLASSASQTATSVNETSVTAEEVKQTAQLSSEKARNVSESAQKAASVAQQGNAAISETVEGMNRIKGQMEVVAENIVKLSEQSQTIGDIITTVNDLAEQSNLLAVNAAIEAAKAGEQGKGFAVVATEVKSLAEQSKQATGQVRTILTDIQKATGAAVMATEQVSKSIEAGVKQTTGAGEAIGELAESIALAAQATTQIAASSQEQLVGINQIGSAMESIKQATQQNVAGTSQAEKAAHDLNELGQRLKSMVERDH